MEKVTSKGDGTRLYKALLKDHTDAITCSFEERTDVDFNEWKFIKAIGVLRPKGEYAEFYIDGARQFFDDTPTK